MDRFQNYSPWENLIDFWWLILVIVAVIIGCIVERIKAYNRNQKFEEHRKRSGYYEKYKNKD